MAVFWELDLSFIPDDTGSISVTGRQGQGVEIEISVHSESTGILIFSQPTVPAGFTVEYISNTTVVRNGIAHIWVRCNGATVGTFSGTFSFNNNDANENPYNFTISCTILPRDEPDMAVFNEADLSFIPDDTGSISVTGRQGQGVEIEISVHSESTGILIFSQPTVPAGFILTDELPGTGGSTIFIIRCVGATAGTFSGEVSMDTNDPDENPYNFNVSCTIT
jgi:hypothetical protein